jgi:hypothetical protein
MPEINQKTLGYVIQFLQQLILPEKAVTKMDEDNLAMTLVPVIFDQNGAIGTHTHHDTHAPTRVSRATAG